MCRAGAIAAERSLTSELNVEVDPELVLHSNGSSGKLDGFDAELGLAQACAADVAALFFTRFDGDGLRHAMQREVAADRPAVARFFDASGLENDLVMSLGIEHVGAEHGLLDL